MTKQILAFLFCFIRELTLYSPLTYSLTSARELKPYTPPLPSPSAYLSARTSHNPFKKIWAKKFHSIKSNYKTNSKTKY
jgi:hypothetical protein